MTSLFNGLDQFGMDDIESVDLFEDEKSVVKNEKEKKEIRPEDMLYDRSVRCPVCNNKFMTRSVKTGAFKLEGTGMTLRPIYSGIDMILYDVVSCTHCGYTALNRNFNKVTDRQARMVKEKISAKFVSKKCPMVYDYRVALNRYKMTLYNDVVIGRNDENKAYVCLKISWIIDGILETETNENKIKELKEERKAFLENAYKGFGKAYKKIIYPVFGMNEATYHYLLGSLAYEMGEMKNSVFWLGKVILSPNVNKRLKDKARELKNIIDEKKKEL